MSALWSRALELLGRLRLPLGVRKKLRVGHPGAPDAQGGRGWRRYLSAERLYDVWGPVAESVWLPFHCVPLFAALDQLTESEVGPAVPPQEAVSGVAPPPPSPLPSHARPGAPAPAWITPESWVFLDLPGPRAVEAGAWLVTAAGCQPVCTFDNWPHPDGVLRAEEILADLLRWATTVADARPRLTATSPPLWICDSRRLGMRSGKPGEFDNRYYLDDSILPGPALLKRAGVGRVVYLTLDNPDPPVLDLEGYFAELLTADIPVLHVDLGAADPEPRSLAAPVSPQRPPRSGFHRSAAGGFGTEVPEPSSSGG